MKDVSASEVNTNAEIDQDMKVSVVATSLCNKSRPVIDNGNEGAENKEENENSSDSGSAQNLAAGNEDKRKDRNVDGVKKELPTTLPESPEGISQEKGEEMQIAILKATGEEKDDDYEDGYPDLGNDDNVNAGSTDLPTDEKVAASNILGIIAKLKKFLRGRGKEKDREVMDGENVEDEMKSVETDETCALFRDIKVSTTGGEGSAFIGSDLDSHSTDGAGRNRQSAVILADDSSQPLLRVPEDSTHSAVGEQDGGNQLAISMLDGFSQQMHSRPNDDNQPAVSKLEGSNQPAVEDPASNSQLVVDNRDFSSEPATRCTEDGSPSVVDGTDGSSQSAVSGIDGSIKLVVSGPEESWQSAVSRPDGSIQLAVSGLDGSIQSAVSGSDGSNKSEVDVSDGINHSGISGSDASHLSGAGAQDDSMQSASSRSGGSSQSVVGLPDGSNRSVVGGLKIRKSAVSSEDGSYQPTVSGNDGGSKLGGSGSEASDQSAVNVSNRSSQLGVRFDDGKKEKCATDLDTVEDIKDMDSSTGDGASPGSIDLSERAVSQTCKDPDEDISRSMVLIDSTKAVDKVSIGPEAVTWDDDDADDEVFISANQKSESKRDKYATTISKEGSQSTKSRFKVSRQMNTTIRVRKTTPSSVTSQRRRWGSLRTIFEKSFDTSVDKPPINTPSFLRPERPAEEFRQNVSWEDVGFKSGSSILDDSGVIGTGNVE